MAAPIKGMIQYLDYDQSNDVAFFMQRKNNLMFSQKVNTDRGRIQRYNKFIQKAEQDIDNLFNNGALENNLIDAINNTMSQSNVNNLTQAVEIMASNIRAAQEGSKKAQKDYDAGYAIIQNLFNQVLEKKNITLSGNKLEQMISGLDSQHLIQDFKEIGNPLGLIGEATGVLLLANMADELLKTTFKKQKNAHVEIINAGDLTTIPDNLFPKGRTITTDNLLIIRDNNNKILFQLNLSNKLNTQFKKTSQSTDSVKLRTTSVNSFLTTHPEWQGPILNFFSYHYDRSNKENWRRIDMLQNKNASKIRQTIAAQIIFDFAFGTKSNFIYNDQTYQDNVQLIAYGTKIMATQNVLTQAFFSKNFNYLTRLVQVETNAKEKRADWFSDENIRGSLDNGVYQGHSVFRKKSEESLSGMLAAQRSIHSITLNYNKTLRLNNIITKPLT